MSTKTKITEWLQTRFKLEHYRNISESELKLQSMLEGIAEQETKNKEVQHALAKSEERFRTLFESASDAIFMMKGPLFTDCNSATEKIFGCHKNQIIGQTPIRFSPEFQPSGLTSENAALEKIGNALAGKPQFFEWKHKKYNDVLFDAEVSLNKLEIDGEVYIQAIVRDITQRKKEEADNHRLAMVANTTNNAVIIADAQGKVEWVNRAFTTITGYSFEEVVGKKPGHFLQGPESDKTTIAFISAQLAQGKSFKDVELINYTKEGKPYWVSLEIQPIFDEGGHLRQYIAIESDITDRKKTQMALADREKRFSNLVHQSPMAVIEWDIKLNVLEWNEAAEKIFGYTRTEAIGHNAFDLVLRSERRDEIESVRIQLISQQGGTRSTNENVTKKGDTIFCEWYNSPLIDDQGKTVGIISMVEEITDKLIAEKLLKESEFKFRQIVQNSPMGIYVYEVNDQNQLILVDTNPAADILTGIDNTKLLGMTIEEAFPGLKQTDIPHHYLTAALHGTPWHTENIYYHEENIKGAFNVNAFQAGQRRVAIMFTNITERIQIENAIKQKNEELIKINIELDRFVYSASHDLRAPISSLLGLLEVARLENNMSAMEKLLDMQKRTLLKLDNFIQDIVNYSRNNRLKVTHEPVDFKTLIEGAFEQLHFMNQLNKLEQRILIAPDLNFLGDSKRITVILNNLISNAIKYADVTKPNPFVEVSVEKTEEGILLTVADNGEGIEELHLPKIFEMFYRATHLSTGSGIGLYIVSEIIQKVKGKIEVDSKKGVGSTFRIYLPAQSIS